MTFLPHHQRTIERLIDRFKDDAHTLALLIGGSLAKGYGDENSDVDFMLIVTDEDYARRQLDRALTYYATDLCDYPGGYVDGKSISVAFLEEVADRGSEPARSAFEKAVVVYSRLPQLNDLLHRITTYPEATHIEKVRSFYAQVLAMQWYVGEAEKRGNPYLLLHTVSDLVLFGGRLILAHNRRLYPYHKWFLRVLENAQDKPADLLASIHALNKNPITENIEVLYEKVRNFRPWIEGDFSWPTQFMFDSELNWRDSTTPVDDL